MPRWDNEEPSSSLEKKPSASPTSDLAEAAEVAETASAAAIPGPESAEDGSKISQYSDAPRARSAPDDLEVQPADPGEVDSFQNPNLMQVGILGGKGVGKSYLFQAMVYRCVVAGILDRYLRNIRPDVFRANAVDRHGAIDRPTFFRIPTNSLVDGYMAWRRLPTTQEDQQFWYRVRFRFNTGLFGSRQRSMEVAFLDGSGEFLERGVPLPFMRGIWEKAFQRATIMIFCLPIWVLFPNQQFMTAVDWEDREQRLAGFDKLVNTYMDIRDQRLRVRAVLALTMADDRRSALRKLHRNWIAPCMNEASAQTYLKSFKRPNGITRYLKSAREISEYIYRELDASPDPLVGQIPGALHFGYDDLWMIPISALDGERLETYEAEWKAWEAEGRPADRKPRHSRFPRPAHAELPLLAAMAECHNALM